MNNEIYFLKYPKMPNLEKISSKDKKIFKAIEDEEIFYATEKIDGTNTQIAITKNNAKIGKRSTFLKDVENPWTNLFFKDEIQDLIKLIQSKIDDNLLIRIYGETFGPKIQQNKYKLKDIDFKVFSVFVTDLNNDKHYCLGRLEMEKLIPEEFLLKLLKKGTISDISKELSKTSDDFNIEVKEGDVYNKFDTYELFLDKNEKNELFVVNFLGIKNKNEEFKEIKKPKKPIDKESLKKEKELKENLLRYVTENRLNNILSKGDITLENKNIGPLIKAMQEDIKEEYCEEILDKELFNKALKSISREIALLVKSKI